MSFAVRPTLLRRQRSSPSWISNTAGQFANWDKDSGEIPESIRQRLADVISTNLKSASPLPMLLKVGENVDATHELYVRTFAHNGYIYIGLHMLCPNLSLK